MSVMIQPIEKTQTISAAISQWRAIATFVYFGACWAGADGETGCIADFLGLERRTVRVRSNTNNGLKSMLSIQFIDNHV
jgi:hypothetical protein